MGHAVVTLGGKTAKASGSGNLSLKIEHGCSGGLATQPAYLHGAPLAVLRGRGHGVDRPLYGAGRCTSPVARGLPRAAHSREPEIGTENDEAPPERGFSRSG
jgi:hypothetical protein